MNSKIIPIIDISDLVNNTNNKSLVCEQIDKACRELGAFYITGHGVDEQLLTNLESLSRVFFDQPLEEKNKISVSLTGKSFNGYIAMGERVTDGIVNVKEGIHIIQECDGEHHPLTKAGLPFYGNNLFPDIPQFRETALKFLSDLKLLIQKIMEAIAISLKLDANYFDDMCVNNGKIRSFIWNYPQINLNTEEDVEKTCGISEHTDSGVLTLLKQDSTGGLQFKTGVGWIEATPISGTLVCNVGDMLERMTGGLYHSVVHRVNRPITKHRLSFLVFLMPNLMEVVKPIEEVVRHISNRDYIDGNFNDIFIDYLRSKHKTNKLFKRKFDEQ